MPGSSCELIKISDLRSHQSFDTSIVPVSASMGKTEQNKPSLEAIKNAIPAISYNKESLCLPVGSLTSNLKKYGD